MATRLERACLIAACVSITAGTAAFAAEPAYPTRPVRLLIPFAAGGGTDTLARIMAPRLGDDLGKPWSSTTGVAPAAISRPRS